MTLLEQWFESMRFAAEVQHVMALRMLRLTAPTARAGREATRMVTEKVSALGEAQLAAAAALISGHDVPTTLARAYVPYRRRVRANYRRLSE